jgi:hypothetical protein
MSVPDFEKMEEDRMNRWMNLQSVLIAGAFFALGFLMADRMTHAGASPGPVAQDGACGAFAGTDGAIAAKSPILIFRGHKIYLVDPARGGAQRPWGDLVE